MYEQRDNTGSLFRNENKTRDNSPDYSGKCMVGGVAMFFDGWLKKTADGKSWMSFSFKPMQKQPATQRQQPPPPERRFSDPGEPPF